MFVCQRVARNTSIMASWLVDLQIIASRLPIMAIIMSRITDARSQVNKERP